MVLLSVPIAAPFADFSEQEAEINCVRLMMLPMTRQGGSVFPR